MIAYNINNGCYNCDIPCEERVFMSAFEEIQCYKICSKIPILKDRNFEIDINNSENIKLIIDALNSISYSK